MSRIKSRANVAPGADIPDVIRLQLRKPRNWNWELSTSRSSPHIPLPVIQLFDDKKKLLVETKAYDRRSWHVSDCIKPRKHYNCDKSTILFNDHKLKKHSTVASADANKYKLSTDDKIRIKEHILKKSRSDVFSYSPRNSVSIDTEYNSRRYKDSVNKKPVSSSTPLKSYGDESYETFRNKRNKEKYAEHVITDANQNIYTLRSCSAGTLLINEDPNKNDVRRRRRRKTTEFKNNSSSSDSEKTKIAIRENHVNPVKKSCSIVRRYTDLSLLSNVRSKYEKQKNMNYTDTIYSSHHKLKTNSSDLKHENLENKLKSQINDVSHRSQDPISMGANFSRHSSKGMSGRRCQSISNICNSKEHFLDPSGREVDAAYKFCNSLPSPNGTAYNNNYEHKPLTKKTSLQHTLSEHVIDPEHQPNDCHPLQWKFTDTQTCDQGYGSERSPEEEIPPPIPSHDFDCEHTIDFCYASYPFITPENTFEVELVKGSRGLGLSVCGGVDSDGSWPGLLRIKRLFPHQPAAASGLLAVGDLLLEANGLGLTGLSNYEALEVLRMTPNKVVLLVCRPPPEVLSTMSPVPDAPPPPPRRASSPPHCMSKMSEEIYETEFEIILNKIHGSLGFTLCKEEEGMVGHYVRALVREPAISDGRIQPGDKIVAVNGVEISAMSHEQAVQFLRQCDAEVLLRLHRELEQTPTDLSPTDISPNASFRPKPNLRQEAVDMLSDLAARKLCSSSPCSSPRHLRHEPATSYYESLCLETDDDDDKAVRPCFLDLYNPNQTPVAVRKSKFNLSLAHNAYELNNLDPEMLDAPNLNCAGYEGDEHGLEDNEYPEEPVSMPPLSTTRSGNFSHKKPTYQSAHPQVEFTSTVCSSKAAAAAAAVAPAEPAAERDLLDNDAQVLSVELNRGWNSRLGFSLQEVDGCTCVSAVYQDSVAAKDGRLKPGDCLLRVNDEMVENMKTSDVIDLLRIIRGPVCITVLRRKLRLD